MEGGNVREVMERIITDQRLLQSLADAVNQTQRRNVDIEVMGQFNRNTGDEASCSTLPNTGCSNAIYNLRRNFGCKRRGLGQGYSSSSALRKNSRESPTFCKELVLLPDNTFSHVPRRGMKAMLFGNGHVVSALEFNVSWDEQAVFESIKNAFSEKLSSCRIEILLGCHNKLVKLSLTPGQKLNGHMLKKIFTQRSIYVRPDRVLLELGGKRAENSDEDIIDVTEASALSFSSVQPSVCVENTSRRENMSSKSTFADDHSLPSESHICRSESVTAKTSVCEDTYRNYVDLLDTGSLSDDSDLNEAISRSLVDIQPMLEESCSLKEILKPLENSLSSEVVRYNITRRNVWDGTVRAMSRPNFSPTKQMDIKFTDNEGISEGAVDLGGPKREFLRLVLEYVRDHSGMFEGPQGKKVLACSIAALKGNSYFYAGQLMAMSIIHGGPPPQFLSPVLTEALICGPDKVIVSAEDVANEEIRSQIILIRDASSEDALEDAVSKASSILALSGCFRRIDMQNRGEVAIDIASWYVLQRTRAAYESFSEGLTALGMLNALKTYPVQLRCLFVESIERLTAEHLENLFKVHLSEAGSNKYHGECITLGFWRDYLQDAELKLTTVSLEEVLVFVTGSDKIPALGFSPAPSVEFLHDEDHRFPIANTCENVIRLPLKSKYEYFRKDMDFGIKNSHGFGRP